MPLEANTTSAPSTRAGYLVWQQRRSGSHPGVVRYAVPVSQGLDADLKILSSQRQLSPEEFIRQLVEVRVADYRMKRICGDVK